MNFCLDCLPPELDVLLAIFLWALGYADDITLLVPKPSGLKYMLIKCHETFLKLMMFCLILPRGSCYILVARTSDLVYLLLSLMVLLLS